MSIIGCVSFWNTKGFGFIDYSDNGEIKSIYTHYTQLIGTDKLKKHSIVRFEIGTNDRGAIAREVEVLDGKIKGNS